MLKPFLASLLTPTWDHLDIKVFLATLSTHTQPPPKKKKNIVKIYGTILNSALLWVVWKLDLQTEVTCNTHSIVDTNYTLLMFLSPGMVFIFFPGFLLWSLFVHQMQPDIVLSLIFCYNFNLNLVVTWKIMSQWMRRLVQPVPSCVTLEKTLHVLKHFM